MSMEATSASLRVDRLRMTYHGFTIIADNNAFQVRISIGGLLGTLEKTELILVCE
jgi:hypothetical protein